MIAQLETPTVTSETLGWQRSANPDDPSEDIWSRPERRDGVVILDISLYGRNVAGFQKTIAKFARIAKRHGQVVEAVSNGTIEVKHSFLKRTVTRYLYKVTLPPMVGEKGRILGHFERAEDGTSQYVHLFDEAGRAIVEGFLPRAGQCDHCGVNRYRNDSYVCETSDGPKIVGSTCLKDFLGIDPGLAIASWEFMSAVATSSENEDGECWGGGGRSVVETEFLCRQAYRVARKHGGYSAEVADLLNRELGVLIFGAHDEHEAAIKRSYDGFDPDLDIQALADYVETGISDFAHNLRIALSQDAVETKRTRIVMAGVGMFVGRALKQVEVQATEAKQAAKFPAPQLIAGNIGDRVDIVGEVVRTFLKENEFGVTCIVAIRTAEGGCAVNFHTGKHRPEAGKVYSIRGTIKRQGRNGKFGTPETTLTRVVYSEPSAQRDLPL